MEFADDYRPEFESLKDLLLDMTQIRGESELLDSVVGCLGGRPHVALARIYLLRKGDRCDTCRMAEQCADRTRCLHLVASHGKPIDPEDDWNRLDGPFMRIPLGVSVAGRVAAEGQGIEVSDLREDPRGVPDVAWAARERLIGFAGHPIAWRGEVRGILAILTRIRLFDEGSFWLRMIAEHLAATLENVRSYGEITRLQRRLKGENEYLREELREARDYFEIVGESPGIKRVLEQIELVAPTDASVLVLGESGTGKELVAREIHARSARRDGPLVRVNCASIPRELYESEFFGHAKGAFTGAVRDRAGRFELADGGTLFLDEVGEIPLELQGKLLRVLQEGTYERVGEERTRSVDVRVIAATNRDLKGDVEAGHFRRDLYYRLDVFPIEVPPLRERIGDVAPLARHFVGLAAKRLGREAPDLRQAELLALQGHTWPGNVRELQNAVERAMIAAQGGRPSFDLFGMSVAPRRSGPPRPTPGRLLTEAELRELERANVVAALELTGGRVYGPGGAAELLGLKPTTLASRMRRMGIQATNGDRPGSAGARGTHGGSGGELPRSGQGDTAENGDGSGPGDGSDDGAPGRGGHAGRGPG